MPKPIIEKIVSGGQTGADRAALDAAIALGIPHGGWCPKGRRAEDGRIPGRYRLAETPGANYLQRTEWNVRDSDGTVLFTLGKAATGGSRKTIEIARRLGGPCPRQRLERRAGLASVLD
ncbi:MAG: putative molybdenum carrier protein [Verrucomicrobiae bacterium]|nr:putative molybdenum carrier protein [Verrucomicrobiae bacterium]